MDSPLEGAVLTTASSAGISIRNVSKTFRLESGETIKAVDDASIEIAPGEFVCLLGPSGHGKSTLMNLVAGFTTPSSGTVAVGGKTITGPGPDRGVVFQRDTLFLWKRVADNIGFGLKARGVPREEREAITNRYLDIIGLTAYARAWPRQLSGGMRRRVAIAAVFANEPDVLLMDEPFVGLDYARRSALHEVLLDLWRGTGRTVLFVTHDIDEAIALADRIIVVRHGQVAWETTVGLERPRVARDLATGRANEIRASILEHLDLGNAAA